MDEKKPPTPADELRAIQARRAAAEDARAAGREAARVSAAIAAETRGIEDDAKYAELEAKHGAANVGRINTPHGMAVVKAPAPLVYRRYVDALMKTDHPDPKRRTSFYDETEKLAQLCRIHPPSREEFDALCEKVPTLVVVAASRAYELGKATAEDDAGKS
jgi:hypothetical protein